MVVAAALALMVHKPPVTIVTVVPETVQTVEVAEAKLTVAPDALVAAIENVALGLKVRYGNWANVIVCGAC